MYLLNVQNLQLKGFLDEVTRPEYAIFSHTWLPDGQEVTFKDLLAYHEATAQGELSTTGSITSRKGFKKIQDFCDKAKSHNIEWAWVDTCCIDKTSSAELSEAINSMFKWYQSAKRCYAFLQDVTGPCTDPSFQDSRWFTRGWTLQELIAPGVLYFYNQAWELIGTIQNDSLTTMPSEPHDTSSETPADTVYDNSDFCDHVSGITLIPVAFLKGAPLADACVAQKMSWASKRNTTRTEDIAYSLLGIFDVNIPLMYGEGPKAFIRLQQSIISNTYDHSILAWGTIISDSLPRLSQTETSSPSTQGIFGVLATSPKEFEDCGDFTVELPRRFKISDFQVTNTGVKLGVNIYRGRHFDLCELSCYTWRYPLQTIKILLQPISSRQHYSRKGRGLWCNSIPWLPPFGSLAFSWRLSTIMSILRGELEGRNQTITIAKDITSEEVRSSTQRGWGTNSILIFLNLPDNHTFTTLYAHTSFQVERNTYQVGKPLLKNCHSIESRPLFIRLRDFRLSPNAFLVLPFALFTLLLSYLNISIGVVVFILIAFASLIDPLLKLARVFTFENTHLFVRRILLLFPLSVGGGPRVNPQTIRACVWIKKQQPISPSNTTEQVMILICYKPMVGLFRVFNERRLTCHLVSVPMEHFNNEESQPIGFNRWPRVHTSLTLGGMTYGVHKRCSVEDGENRQQHVFVFTIEAKEN